MKKDCGFTCENYRFRYRACAIIIENDCVLLASNEKLDYFYSVGGGVHMYETAEDAVRREVLEEAGVAYEIERLAFVHENFFGGDGITDGLKCHEIAFYFIMKPKGIQELNSNNYSIEGKEFMNWIPINELKNHKVYPTFLLKNSQIYLSISSILLQIYLSVSTILLQPKIDLYKNYKNNLQYIFKIK